MNKRKAMAVILYIAAVLFVIGFGVLLWRDYTVYYPYGSAPFDLYVIERAIELLIPAILCVVAGRTIKRKAVDH